MSGALIDWHEHLGRRRGSGTCVGRIGDDADQFRGRGLVRFVADADPGGERRAATEIPRYERLVHDHDARRARAIAIVERAAGAPRHAHRVEISAARDRRVRRRQRRSSRTRDTVDQHARAEELLRRKLRREARAPDVGQRFDAPRELFEEHSDRFARPVLLLRQRQAHGNHGAGVHAGVDPLQVEKTPEQQPGAEREHHRERHFGHDEPLPRPPRADAGRSSNVRRV